jgi:hypothetical protein
VPDAQANMPYCAYTQYYLQRILIPPVQPKTTNKTDNDNTTAPTKPQNLVPFFGTIFYGVHIFDINTVRAWPHVPIVELLLVIVKLLFVTHIIVLRNITKVQKIPIVQLLCSAIVELLLFALTSLARSTRDISIRM